MGKWVPGDNWVICDVSGRKVLMSQTQKTWDGLRVAKDWWDPRHPQLDVKGVPDRMAVYDGRPRPADQVQFPDYGTGNIVLESDNGVVWLLGVTDAGAVAVSPWQSIVTPKSVYLGGYLISVDDDGNVSLSSATTQGPDTWLLTSPDGSVFEMVSTGGTLAVTAV